MSVINYAKVHFFHKGGINKVTSFEEMAKHHLHLDSHAHYMNCPFDG